MEYVESDLKKVLNTSQKIKFTDEHVKCIIYNSLCSLNFFHSANVIHRDIKPANLLVDGECQVKLCDFGFSRTLPTNLVLPKYDPQKSPDIISMKQISNSSKTPAHNPKVAGLAKALNPKLNKPKRLPSLGVSALAPLCAALPPKKQFSFKSPKVVAKKIVFTNADSIGNKKAIIARIQRE